MQLSQSLRVYLEGALHLSETANPRHARKRGCAHEAVLRVFWLRRDTSQHTRKRRRYEAALRVSGCVGLYAGLLVERRPPRL